jgi:hypothetical protein
MRLPTIPTWYLPSFYGDIQLKATSDTTCDVLTTELTKQERDALLLLEDHAQKEGWIDPGTMLTTAKIALKAPIGQVATELAKLLKPGRTVISAVRFKDGTMEEIHQSEAQPLSTSKKSKSKADPAVATTVGAPVRGCPPPDFCQAEVRAQRVLAAFLTPDQIDDFKRYQKFISVGQTTGNRYMITSRHARDQLAQYTRTLYDLDRKAPVCTHDWDVPAAEEMLALHVLLQLPGWETYLNDLTEDNVDDVLGNGIQLGHGVVIRNARAGRDIV